MVRPDERLALLTSHGLAAWLKRNTRMWVATMTHTRIKDALQYEDSNNVDVLSGDHTVADAVDLFATALNRGIARLSAIVLTADGNHLSDPLGIVTASDLLPYIKSRSNTQPACLSTSEENQ